MLIAAWPDRQCRPEIIAWLLSNGFDVKDPAVLQVYSGLGKTDYEITARNLAVRDIALKSAAQDFIFIDKDIVPGPATDSFLRLIGDVVGAEFPTACPDAWRSPQDVHAGLLRCSRACPQRPARAMVKPAARARSRKNWQGHLTMWQPSGEYSRMNHGPGASASSTAREQRSRPA